MNKIFFILFLSSLLLLLISNILANPLIHRPHHQISITKDKIVSPPLLHLNYQLYPYSSTRSGWYELGGGFGWVFDLSPEKITLTSDYLYQSHPNKDIPYSLHNYSLGVSFDHNFFRWSETYQITFLSTSRANQSNPLSLQQHHLTSQFTLKTLPLYWSYQNQVTWLPTLAATHELGIEIYPETDDLNQYIGLYLKKKLVDFDFIFTFQFWLRDRLIYYFIQSPAQWIIKLSYQLNPNVFGVAISFIKDSFYSQTQVTYSPRIGNAFYMDTGYYLPTRINLKKSSNKVRLTNEITVTQLGLFKNWLADKNNDNTIRQIVLQNSNQSDLNSLWLKAFFLHRQTSKSKKTKNHLTPNLQSLSTAGLSDPNINLYYYRRLLQYYIHHILKPTPEP